jgi:hypothetical protein
MRRLVLSIAILAAVWALAGCGGATGGSSIAPVTWQNAQVRTGGSPGSAGYETAGYYLKQHLEASRNVKPLSPRRDDND